jgi:hypothetical protein
MLRPVLRTLAAASLLALVAGPALAADPDDCDCPDSFEQVLKSPRRLLERTEDALRSGNPRLAYRYAALLRLLHPDSKQTAQAFDFACRAFKPIWRRERLADPTSNWALWEPQFMFTWLASFFTEDEFPKQQVNSLLLRMPDMFFSEYEAFVAREGLYTKPPITQWKLEMEHDDGLVTAIRATRVAPTAAATPSGG